MDSDYQIKYEILKKFFENKPIKSNMSVDKLIRQCINSGLFDDIYSDEILKKYI